MATYLQILNKARNRQKQPDLSSAAIQGSSGDALTGVQAVSKAVQVLYENSFDLDAGEFAADISTTNGTSLLPAPANSWDSNVIRSLKVKDSGTDFLRPLTLIDIEEAEDYKLKSYQSNEPLFWWVNQNNVYILPVPTTVYTLKVFYQAILPDISGSNMSDVVVLPNTAIHALVDLTYAYLREHIGDPQWEALEGRGRKALTNFLERNKHTYKRRGFRKVTVVPRRADRRL